MDQELYTIFLIIAGSLIGFCGAYLLVGTIPKKLKATVYNDSRKLLGSSYLVVSASIGLFFLFDLRNLDSSYRIALNISIYHIAAKLFALAYIILLGKRNEYNHRKYRWNYLISYSFPACVWLTVLIPNPDARLSAQITAAIVLTLSIVTDIIYFFKKYKEFTARFDQYYSKNIRPHIQWMVKTLHHLVIIGITCASVAIVTSRASRWILAAYLVYFTVLEVVIFFKYINFISVFSDIPQYVAAAEAIATGEYGIKKISSEKVHDIEMNLNQWIKEKRFCENDVTIMTLSKELTTNRLYLSTYINHRYDYSFKVWLSKLRIAEAKALMLDENRMTITTIAEKVGYVSLASFTHAFKNMEGIPPKEWLNINKNSVRTVSSRRRRF